MWRPRSYGDGTAEAIDHAVKGLIETAFRTPLEILERNRPFRVHHWGAAVGVLIGGAASIGWMAVVNFLINSDFKWVLLGMALLWAASLALFVLESRSHPC